jgi:hypothetical protein
VSAVVVLVTWAGAKAGSASDEKGSAMLKVHGARGMNKDMIMIVRLSISWIGRIIVDTGLVPQRFFGYLNVPVIGGRSSV